MDDISLVLFATYHHTVYHFIKKCLDFSFLILKEYKTIGECFTLFFCVASKALLCCPFNKGLDVCLYSQGDM